MEQYYNKAVNQKITKADRIKFNLMWTSSVISISEARTLINFSKREYGPVDTNKSTLDCITDILQRASRA